MVEVITPNTERDSSHQLQCKKCGKELDECLIEAHHVHPRFMDNPKGTGMKAYICGKCHTLLHGVIMKYLWNHISEEDKPRVIKRVIHEGKLWGGLE